MLDVASAVANKYPKIHNYPKMIRDSLNFLAKKVLYQDPINAFLSEHENLESFEFIDAVLEYFDFSYSLSNKGKRNIPSSGRVLIIANHPLGALDALCLISLIREVRADIKVIANDILMQIPQLSSLLIPVDNISKASSKEQIKNIYNALLDDNAVIIFPSGEVSRARVTGIKDTQWQSGFLRFAKKTNSPILPVFIDAKNSPFFYTLSALNKSVSTLFLVREMFLQRSKGVGFKIGELIPFKNIEQTGLSQKVLINLLKKHLYNISKNKAGIFATQTCIAHPEDRQEIKAQLREAQLLGQTADEKKIYLCEHKKNSALMREIGRLRELTFRKVEEGTGARRDMDKYDRYYKHIVLWDEDKLEVVGGYRIGESDFITKNYGNSGFYVHSLFAFEPEFIPYLNASIELGRSFVQPNYWGSRALDYLWQGIGAYLSQNPHVRYMFGPVSLSDAYPKIAKNLLICFYELYYASPSTLIQAREPFFMSKQEQLEARGFFAGDDHAADFKILKEQLANIGLSVPTLYKQYTELCDDGGIVFGGFNVDKAFANCVDSFILVDIKKIKEAKAKRYIKSSI